MVMIYGSCDPNVSQALVPFFSIETLSGWREYFEISLPATVMICSEWWALEFITLMAGTLGVAELASQTICFQMI